MSATHDQRQRTRATLTGAAALMLSLVPVAALLLRSPTPESAVAGVAAAAGALSVFLVVVALVLLFGDGLRLGRRSTALMLGSSLLACAGFALLGLSFGTGMNDADAGRPVSLFGNLTTLFAAVAALACATAAGTAVVVVLRRTRLPRWAVAALAVPIALVAVPALLVSLLTPQSAVMAASALLVVTAVTGPRMAVAARPAPAPRALRQRVRLLGLGSLLYTAAVWAGGAAASIAGTGTETATSALGYASAAAQLSAVPLIVAVTMLVAARAAGRAARAGAVLAILVVVTASAALVAVYDPASDSFVQLAGAISLGVGAWIGTLLWQLGGTRATPDRLVLAVAGGLGGVLLYAALCALTGGLGLLLASGFLLIGGRMLVPGRPGALSPATLPAS